mgnify:CR=1 FL=1
MTTRWYGVHDPSNMRNFATDSYNLTNKGSWCVHNNSLYTNPQAKFGYFNSKCGDPYTYYNFWYRRFPHQTNYLNCYFLPHTDPLLKNTYGYVRKPANCNNNLRNYGSNVHNDGFKYYVTRPNTNSP